MNGNYRQCVPTLEEAMLILKCAERLNPGDLVKHSMYVADGAKLIEQTENLDSELAEGFL